MDKLSMHSKDIVEDNISKIAELFPNTLTEVIKDGKVTHAIDFDLLKQELSDIVVEGPAERYQFTWPDKRKSILLANSPIAKTLRPCREESVDFDATENLYIEGDNLDALKLLQETYLGKVKLIYIDPPYNTGKDFIYNDRFIDSKQEYLGKDGSIDNAGNLLSLNNETSGRYHTSWLNMLYPRIKISKELLQEEGVLFISIDHHEHHNLKKICDEIYGESNFLGEIIWQTATDNNPSQISMEHEYILCYAKNIFHQSKWESPSIKAKLITKKYNELKNQGNDLNSLQKELKKWIKLNESNLQGVNHYSYVDEKGVYYPGNSSNTKPGGYKYDIIHPATKKPCKKPDFGYRWPEGTFWDSARNGDVEWGTDETTIPKIKKRVETATEKLKSIYYEDNRYWTKYLRKR